MKNVKEGVFSGERNRSTSDVVFCVGLFVSAGFSFLFCCLILGILLFKVQNIGTYNCFLSTLLVGIVFVFVRGEDGGVFGELRRRNGISDDFPTPSCFGACFTLIVIICTSWL